ncbi:MAG: amidohydrolase family protein [Roseibium sp.]
MLPPIIDSHVHWRDPVNNRYEALSDSASEDGERGGSEAEVYLAADYMADASGFDIAGIVHIEAEWDKSNPVDETDWLHDLIANDKTGGLPIAVVGFADLTASDVDEILEAHAARPLTRGIRQMLNHVPGRPELCWSPVDHLENPIWRKNYGLLAKHGLGFDLMCFGHQMEPMAKLAAQHRDIPLHLEHAGLPWDHTAEGRQVWRDGMCTLAKLEHADVKISGLGNTVPDWTTASIRDYVLETIDIFGVERISFASNFPTDKQFSDMATIWNAFDEITKDFSGEERTAMFHDNAVRMYALKLD